MKKTVTVLLIATVLVLTLVGCAAQSATNDQALANKGASARQEEIYLAPQLDSPSVSLSTLQETATMLTREEAKVIALEHAGVTEVFDLEIELDKDSGILHYEVDFETAEAEFDYEIEAYTGEILKSRKEEREAKPVTTPEANTPTTEQTKLTAEEAKAIALNHAGVTEVFDLDIELEKEKGVLYYEIDFDTADAEYDYAIEAYTGEILKSKKKEEKQPAATIGTLLTKDAVKALALEHAGVTPSWVEVELDKDGGITKYEIEFQFAGYEYEYEIEAYTGEILKSHKEWDD